MRQDMMTTDFPGSFQYSYFCGCALCESTLVEEHLGTGNELQMFL